MHKSTGVISPYSCCVGVRELNRLVCAGPLWREYEQTHPGKNEE